MPQISAKTEQNGPESPQRDCAIPTLPEQLVRGACVPGGIFTAVALGVGSLQLVCVSLVTFLGEL